VEASLSARSSLLATAILYADFIEKIPFASKCQAGQSSMSTSIGIRSISSASHGQKVSYTNCMSQSPVTRLISSFTLVIRDVRLGVAGFLVVPLGSQGSSHILTLYPFSIHAKLVLPLAAPLLLGYSSMYMKFLPL
jgi:hypothetical protein